ncbi:MAG: bifunctional 5,10-methylenetetrahydrofolate dehydrogenase/5,10-methenyltetrahydrofolate cyclohydrolase, partial [Candidatus Omnitrophica bacterium]|nr:bifunctional 5,10-methylenetetrahydrofolate dehydrogenase/5,10-methenyltetrahydrofolate cyclohydrolase [Candidatus Omnitrophota bacterium]
MPANLIPGKEIAARIQEKVKEKVNELKTKGVTPRLVAVQVGENAASAVYVKAQAKSCEKIGIRYTLHQMPPETPEVELISTLQAFNADSTVTGIILQLPLPGGMDVRKIQSFISPVKDVEGVNPTNMGWIVYGRPGLAPCTALAIKECIDYTGVKLYGKEVV